MTNPRATLRGEDPDAGDMGASATAHDRAPAKALLHVLLRAKVPTVDTNPPLRAVRQWGEVFSHVIMTARKEDCQMKNA